MTVYGYARVSDPAQDHGAQVEALTAAGCERIFSEKRSAAAGRARPVLRQAIAGLEPGDVLIVARMDRLARSALDALRTIAEVGERGAAFRSLREAWADTTTAQGRFMVTVFAGVAELDREMILERTRDGRQAARKRGVKMGRRPTLDARQRAFVRDQLARGQKSINELAAILEVSRSTIIRANRPTAAEQAAPTPLELAIGDRS